MLYGIKFVASYLLGTDIAGRNMAVHADDTFIVSFPRSGNTWTRFLIANLMRPELPVTFADIEKVIPDIHSQSSRALKRSPRPRLLKSHEYFDPRYRKVIYLVRDPRDVLISLYHFRRKYRSFDDGYPIEKYAAERFLSGDMDVSWAEHVSSWMATRKDHPGFMLLRYEDMLEDSTRELHRVADFLGLSAGAERVSLAIERSAVDRMRTLEKAEHELWVTTKGKRRDIPFVAAGRSGAWKSVLSDETVGLIESAWGGLMQKVGYELSLGHDPNPRRTTMSAAKQCENSRE